MSAETCCQRLWLSRAQVHACWRSARPARPARERSSVTLYESEVVAERYQAWVAAADSQGSVFLQGKSLLAQAEAKVIEKGPALEWRALVEALPLCEHVSASVLSVTSNASQPEIGLGKLLNRSRKQKKGGSRKHPPQTGSIPFLLQMQTVHDGCAVILWRLVKYNMFHVQAVHVDWLKAKSALTCFMVAGPVILLPGA